MWTECCQVEGQGRTSGVAGGAKDGVSLLVPDVKGRCCKSG